jgi:dimethylhistidine N-methyltransferase
VPNDTGFAPQDPRADILDIALAGLTATPKTLPAMLFYDDEGCRLFYEITRLPEYYLTRTETALLASIGPALIPDGFRAKASSDVNGSGDANGFRANGSGDAGGPGHSNGFGDASGVSNEAVTNAVLVEFGGSDETKARILLDRPDTPFTTYVSIDVAAPALSAMQARLAASHPGLAVVPIVADFMQPLRLPHLGSQRMGFFPGSTIGNLDPVAATRFLAAARHSLGPDSWFLLGADLRKSPKVLLPAYNDAAGVTAAFNLNLLRRLNREAGADFDVAAFRHEAVWNDAASRIEMHLVSRRDQIVHLGARTIHFREGESIHTENSYKHPPEQLVEIARRAGWEMQRIWKDPAGLFGVFLLRGG